MLRSSLSVLISVLLLTAAARTTAAIEWEPHQELTAGSEAKRWAEFGRAVAIDRKTLVVGSYGDGSGSENEAGSVFIFELADDSKKWKFTQQLRASDAIEFDYFGDAVALQGDTLVVGAWGRDGYKGAVYIFHKTEDGVWKQTQKLVSTVSEIYADFGRSLALDGDTLVVGEPWANGPDNNMFMGSAYVYGRSNATYWKLEAELVASWGDKDNNGFGWDVDVSGDSVLVGAPPYPDAGYAVVFQRTAKGGFDAGFKIKASDGSENDDFGRSVAIENDTVIVSSRDACFVYKRSPELDDDGITNTNVWMEEQKLVSGGYFVALDGNNLLYDRTFYHREDEDSKFKQINVLGTGETTSVVLSRSTAVIGDRLSNGYTGKAYVFVSSENEAFTGTRGKKSDEEKEDVGQIVIWSVLGFFLLCGLSLPLYFCCCRRTKEQKRVRVQKLEQPEQPEQPDPEQPELLEQPDQPIVEQSEKLEQSEKPDRPEQPEQSRISW